MASPPHLWFHLCLSTIVSFLMYGFRPASVLWQAPPIYGFSYASVLWYPSSSMASAAPQYYSKLPHLWLLCRFASARCGCQLAMHISSGLQAKLSQSEKLSDIIGKLVVKSYLQLPFGIEIGTP
jgi:hypothetical protein